MIIVKHKQIIKKINDLIVFKMLLIKEDNILITISGGQDSTFLLHIFIILKTKWNWNITVIHCDHKWSSISKKRAFEIYKLSKKLETSYYQSLLVKIIQKEDYARAWRYRILQYIAIYHKYNIIVTAHNATDRIETLLYNLFRGAGIQGLQALNWQRDSYIDCSFIYVSYINKKTNTITIQYLIDKNSLISNNCNLYLKIIRPLLEMTRHEIYNNILKEYPLYFDKSNLKTYIQRNRIRQIIIPYIKTYYNRCLDQAIMRFCEILSAENFFFLTLNKSLMHKIRINVQYKNTKLKHECIYINILISLPIAMQRRILYIFLYKNINNTINYDYVEKIRLWCLHNIFFEKKNIYILEKKNQYSDANIMLTKQRQLRIINKSLLCIFT